MNHEIEELIIKKAYDKGKYALKVKKELDTITKFTNLMYNSIFANILDLYVKSEQENYLAEIGIINNNKDTSILQLEIHGFMNNSELECKENTEADLKYCGFFKELGSETELFNILYVKNSDLHISNINILEDKTNDCIIPIDYKHLENELKSDGFSVIISNNGILRVKIKKVALTKLIENVKEKSKLKIKED